MTSKRFTTTLVHDATMSFIPIPFDPKEVFGKVRVPVKVTLNGYTFASTIFSMGGLVGIPLRKSHRDAAKVVGGQTLPVTLALDTTKRTVKPPADLVKALKAAGAMARWGELSYTHQREHVEAIDGAKADATRVRRIAAAVKMVKARKPR